MNVDGSIPQLRNGQKAFTPMAVRNPREYAVLKALGGKAAHEFAKRHDGATSEVPLVVEDSNDLLEAIGRRLGLRHILNPRTLTSASKNPDFVFYTIAGLFRHFPNLPQSQQEEQQKQQRDGNSSTGRMVAALHTIRCRTSEGATASISLAAQTNLLRASLLVLSLSSRAMEDNAVRAFQDFFFPGLFPR